MTTGPTVTTRSTDSSIRDIRPAAALAVLVAVALTALGIFGDGTPGKEPQVREFFVVCGLIAFAAAVVFGWLVPRGLRKESAGGRALILAVLGLLLVPIFLGISPVLAGGAIVLGLAGRGAAKGSRLCTAAVVVGALALVADIGIHIADWMNTNGML